MIGAETTIGGSATATVATRRVIEQIRIGGHACNGCSVDQAAIFGCLPRRDGRGHRSLADGHRAKAELDYTAVTTYRALALGGGDILQVGVQRVGQYHASGRGRTIVRHLQGIGDVVAFHTCRRSGIGHHQIGPSEAAGE